MLAHQRITSKMPLTSLFPALWTFLLALHCAVVAGFMFQVFDRGAILNPPKVVSVARELECAFFCRRQLVCSAFSVRQDPAKPGLLECKVSLGEFQWVPDVTSRLYGEYIGDRRGYTLAHDGNFYKVFTDPKKTSMQSRETCVEDEQGDLAVPYPAEKYQAVVNTPGFIDSTFHFFLGAMRTGNATDTRWITDDGTVFQSNNQTLDTDQKWVPGQPALGDDYLIIALSTGKWEAGPGTAQRDYICRRKIAKYIKSPVNGAYYKASTQKLSQMAAGADCHSDGGNLAIVTTELDLLATEPYRTRQRGYSDGFFIAGDDSAQEGTWVFPNGATFSVSARLTDPFQGLFWDPNGPSTSTLENCLIMGFKGVTSAPCNGSLGTRRFLCQIVLP